jgi:cation diffusion facilitator family transporter
MEHIKKVRNVLYYTLILNIIVAVVKIVYGYSINSISMLSDGFHSFFDGTSNIIGLIGIWIASQPPDRNHPYGHRKFETLSTIAIAVLIFIAGYEILKRAYLRINIQQDIDVTITSFIIMAFTLTVNTAVMRYETRKSKELKSEFLLADAMHTKTDIFVSLSVIISLIAAKAGYSVIDTITAIIITFLIARMGFSILKGATNVLTDAACIDPDAICKVVQKVTGVKGCHEIRTRGKEGAINIDLHVLVDPKTTTKDSHDLAHSVEDAIKREFPSIVDVVIHIEPYRERVL